MSLSLNPRIIEKLNAMECDEIIIQFLKELLYFELQMIEEGSPRYKNKYDGLIERHTELYLEDEGNEA